MPNIAFVIGANGISGAAIVEYLVNNTTSEQWSHIIVSSRTPFETTINDPRISSIALDFSHDMTDFVEKTSNTREHVTHAYFCSYAHSDDFAELDAANTDLFQNFILSLQGIATDLQKVTLQTRGKHYGGHLVPIPFPTREVDPRAKGHYVYHSQEDLLISEQKGKKWNWNVIRSVAILGVTSKPNGMNQALTLALYFLVCKELGSSAPLPTNQRYWDGVDDASYAPLIADLTIFVSTRSKCANQDFNIANGDYFSWRYLWPRLASYFGVEAETNQKFSLPFPREGSVQQETLFTSAHSLRAIRPLGKHCVSVQARRRQKDIRLRNMDVHRLDFPTNME